MRTFLAALVFILIALIALHILMKKVSEPAVLSSTVEAEEPYYLEEVNHMSASKNADWWLSSGGKVHIEDNSIVTLQGELSTYDIWRERFSSANPEETDNGFHPQNIFRLVSRLEYANFTQQAYFKINHYYFKKDIYRAASNGIFFFNRYQDQDNTYYVGLRVDGAAVVKKKYKGIYYTLGLQQLFTSVTYDRDSNPNLLPLNTWIGLKSEVFNEGNNVVIHVFTDLGQSGNWTKVLEVKDNGEKTGGKVIKTQGHGGIRTDFMDAEIKDYQFQEYHPTP